MKSTEAARALAARRKSHGPKPVRRWKCVDCSEMLGTNEMRRHVTYQVDCAYCGERLTKSQTRTHRC